MRIELNSLDDFLSEIEADGVYQDVVRVRVDRVPEQKEQVTFALGIWVTALSKDAEWLYELGLPLGSEKGKRGAKGGAEIAQEMQDKLKAKCDELGITIRPGKIEKY